MDFRSDHAVTFTVDRHNDESGVSGTGVILDGIVFPDGKVAIRWRGSVQSTVVYDSLRDFMFIHIDSHPTNDTVVTFSNGFRYFQESNKWINKEGEEVEETVTEKETT